MSETGEERPKPGARGRATTPMLPSGRVMIDGVVYNARCRRGSADVDDEVVVVGFDAFGLIVTTPESHEDDSELPQTDPEEEN